MSSNTRNAGLSEPSEAKVVSQGIDTDEMNRHHLIDHVQLDKKKFYETNCRCLSFECFANGAIKREWRRIDKT